MRLLLLRHGKIADSGVFYGHLDVELSPSGLRQAETAANALQSASIDAVYSSDLQRAAIGARLLADPRSLEVSQDPAFREMSLGVLEGHDRSKPHDSHPEKLNKRYADMVDFAFPGGESFEQVAARARPALTRILEKHIGGTVALVGHNSVNRIIVGDVLGLPLSKLFGFQQSFGCINCIDYADTAGRGRLRVLNWKPTGIAPES